MNKIIREELSNYLANNQKELIDLLITLCKIPAPSNHEELRAEFILEWLQNIGAEGAYIDDALNVVFPYYCDDNAPINVIMAHTDTVFPDLEPFEVINSTFKIECPGVGDNTVHVCMILLSIKYILENNLIPKEGILFVLDAGEEGLGNLKGSRKIMEDFGHRVKEFAALDGIFIAICNRAVGSKRYRVTVHTQGGHSNTDFGRANAIQILSSIITTLYTYQVPEEGNNTYNVGTIEGGTSVNTIAQDASMLFEYRSDSNTNLNMMDQYFYEVIESHRDMALSIDVEVIGERPAMGDNIDEEKQAALEKEIVDIIKKYTRLPDVFKVSASTDCNIPFSMGIPSVGFGGFIGRGAHTREEYLYKLSLPIGSSIIGAYIMKYF